MRIATALKQAILSAPIGREWLEARRRNQRQSDWTTLHREKLARTSLSVYTTVGLGDVMIAKQLCEEFRDFGERSGDPKLGDIVIVAGAWPLEFKVSRGDHNVYWWWSMSGEDDWLDRYLAESGFQPDVVACLSQWCCEYSERLGARPVYLPLAVGRHFTDFRMARAGIGYAGSKGHKDPDQVAKIVRPFEGQANFSWVSGFTTPRELCEYYNSRQIVLGMTEAYQEKAGMVNNRVFEVLATGTPFIIHKHRALEEVLGCSFPYQSESAGQTIELAENILADYPSHLAQFARYRQIVEEKHLYRNRFQHLISSLAGRN